MRQIAWMLIFSAGVCAATASLAQQKRPYNELMKDVAATYASVKKNLDANVAPAAAADAAKLQSLFKETEDFWAQFKTKDALDAAKGARGQHEASRAPPSCCSWPHRAKPGRWARTNSASGASSLMP